MKAIPAEKLLTEEEFDEVMTHVRLRGDSSLTRTIAHAHHVLGQSLPAIKDQYNCTRQNAQKALTKFAKGYDRYIHGYVRERRERLNEPSQDEPTEMRVTFADKLLTQEEFEGAMTYVRVHRVGGDSSLTRTIAHAFHVLGQPLSLILTQHNCTRQNAVRALERFAKGYEHYMRVQKHLAKIGAAAQPAPAPAPETVKPAAEKPLKPAAKKVGAHAAKKTPAAKKAAARKAPAKKTAPRAASR